MRLKKILVVDDQSNILEIISLLLQKEGYEVSTANNGKEGIKELHRTRPDLVLTDISMPDMDGIEFLRMGNSPRRRIHGGHRLEYGLATTIHTGYDAWLQSNKL